MRRSFPKQVQALGLRVSRDEIEEEPRVSAHTDDSRAAGEISALFEVPDHVWERLGGSLRVENWQKCDDVCVLTDAPSVVVLSCMCNWRTGPKGRRIPVPEGGPQIVS